MTGDATIIRLYRERRSVEQAIRYDATNLAAIDRFNELSRLLAKLDPGARMALLVRP